MVPKVKICGIRTLDDVEIMNEFLPEYVGFILANSKRKVSIYELGNMIEKLTPNIKPVGVFVNEEIHVLIEAVSKGIKVIQLHGDEDVEYIEEAKKQLHNKNIEIWKAVRINSDIESIEQNQYNQMVNIDGILLDKYSKKHYGGTGETFDWNLIKGMKFQFPLILSGGLNQSNIVDAINIIKPFCVDLSTGVETENKKDRDKVRNFIEKVRKDEIENEK